MLKKQLLFLFVVATISLLKTELVNAIDHMKERKLYLGNEEDFEKKRKEEIYNQAHSIFFFNKRTKEVDSEVNNEVDNEVDKLKKEMNGYQDNLNNFIESIDSIKLKEISKIACFVNYARLKRAFDEDTCYFGDLSIRLLRDEVEKTLGIEEREFSNRCFYSCINYGTAPEYRGKSLCELDESMLKSSKGLVFYNLDKIFFMAKITDEEKGSFLSKGSYKKWLMNNSNVVDKLYEIAENNPEKLPAVREK